MFKKCGVQLVDIKILWLWNPMDTAVWGINETCPVTVGIPFEQNSAIFDDICP